MSDASQGSARQLATDARDRVRFEEEALDLSDQVYGVARRLVGSREEAEDLVQETYARAFRSWRSFQPGTNLRAWLFRILTNLNIDRGRKVQRTPDQQPLEENDYYLYNRLEETGGDGSSDQSRVVDRLSQNDAVTADPRHPDRDRDVPPPPWPTDAQGRARDVRDRVVMSGFAFDPCDKCEQMMQPYIDRYLTDSEIREAEEHLDGCEYCRKRYRFEVECRPL